MRPLPVDLPARRARGEIVDMSPRLGRDTVDNVVLGHRRQHPVAEHAPTERQQPSGQAEATDDLGQLSPGIGGSDVVAVNEETMLQQLGVPVRRTRSSDTETSTSSGSLQSFS